MVIVGFGFAVSTTCSNEARNSRQRLGASSANDESYNIEALALAKLNHRNIAATSAFARRRKMRVAEDSC
jgi:hypothetical protein